MLSVDQAVRRNKILNDFCGDKMWWEPVLGFRYDANILNNSKNFVGIAKIFSQMGNFASKPIVEISQPDLEFVYELGLLTGKAPAIIVKFRNKVAYFKLENLNYSMGVGKKEPTYKIPIQDFVCV